MGVPKFFRYISERYPCLSEVVKDYQIPEFDNLYLDMNGIIHTCSHPDDGDPHFRISEEKILQDIFHYIEVLFRMIKPQKVFFMAVDGVAPRAKMNQQRGRRFRSAKEALDLENKARERGEVLPTEARFDSNCITPGTVFMTNLHEQLKYFIVNKISTDKLWSKCKVILSGHETPGEGEHKIMDYIRYLRAQPGYDPNTRHCLYGLDADLIMLGLCTHEPHFSLLREEVKFGKKSNSKRKNVPEETKFFLLHLSLMREYLELEFYSLKDSLSFDYDMEKIIDDWVLMGFLVGNDFIPHLPNMHITNGALPILYKAYMEVLPTLDGYINEGGTLNLIRFEAFIEKLSCIDIDTFTEKFADLKWFQAKTGQSLNDKMNKRPNKLRQLESWQPETDDVVDEPIEKSSCEPALAALIKSTNDMLIDSSESSTQEDKDLEEDIEMESDSDDDLLNAEFIQHKNDYYINKLSYPNVTPEVLRSQTEEYVRAIQWNLHYYYDGVCSWSWYYPHHYAPYVSDVKGFSDFKIHFELGTPFKPYEQLLGVLPAASKSLLPVPFQNLMVNENSPIKEYYPDDFKTDLNGKKQEWEAVVLIPFIEEDVLLKAMTAVESELTLEEKSRNRHGPMLVYKYSVEDFGPYEATKYFPKISNSHAMCERVTIEDIRIPREKLIKGAYPGAKFDVYYPGFPTMKHLKYTGQLQKAKVKVFEQPSRSESMILNVINEQQELDTNTIARNLLGTTVHVGWPHLIEALVVRVTDKEHVIKSVGKEGQYNVEQNRGELFGKWNAEKSAIDEFYKNRLGINVGSIDVLVNVKVLAGRKYTFTNVGYVTLEKQWADMDSAYPLQTVISKLKVYEESYTNYKDIASVFPLGSTCFMLGQPFYGSLGEVLDSQDSLRNGRLKLAIKKSDEPDLTPVIEREMSCSHNYMNLHVAAIKSSVSKYMFSRITGTMLVLPLRNPTRRDDSPRTNIGLNLKFTKKNEEIPGYTKKEGNMWKYSYKAIDLVRSYMEQFPDIFEKLKAAESADNYFEEDLFPEGNAKEKLNEMITWMKKHPYYSVERQSCGSEVIEPEAVQMLENLIDEYKRNKKPCAPVSVQVKPRLLFKPNLQIGNLMPDPTATFQLYDRVVNVREGYSVPLGLKGTIIGIHRLNCEKEIEIMYDVLFDDEFAGGMAINCTKSCGYRMPVPAIINISHGLRETNRSSSKPSGNFNRGNEPNRGPRYNSVPPFLQNSTVIYPSQLSGYQNTLPQNWSRGPNFPSRPLPNVSNAPPQTNPTSYTPPGYPAFNNYKSGPNSFVPYKGNNTAGGQYFLRQAFVRESKPPQKNVVSELNKPPGEQPNAILNKKAHNMSNNSAIQNTNPSNLKIDTDMLKKMLKINETSHSNHPVTPPSNSNHVNTPRTSEQFYSRPPVSTVPEPPKKWQNFTQSKYSARGKQGEPNKVTLDKTCVNNGSTSSKDTAFVPLQAVRQHRRKMYSNKGALNSSRKTADESGNSEKIDVEIKIHSSKSHDNMSKSSYKPRRQRQMRLAANFPAAQN